MFFKDQYLVGTRATETGDSLLASQENPIKEPSPTTTFHPPFAMDNKTNEEDGEVEIEEGSKQEDDMFL